ncbi:MAG: saccharopine dehydrogenase C-terminal domain-containing protein [Rhodothermales bacterium]|nr:saccharopine dehydrogenase C-terminal domain-containing protein [Rhodothermales bacterium]
MRISIIGAGAIGSRVASELASREEVDEVRVCDAGSRPLKLLHDTVESPKVRSYQVDARDESVLRPIIADSQCVVGCAAPELNPIVAAMSIDLGSHFCDMGGSGEVLHAEMNLKDAALSRGVWVLPGCGLAPGLINLLCLLGVEQFDRVDTVHLRVGDVPLHPEPPFNFRLSVSARKLIDDYSLPAYVLRDGDVIEVDPLSGVEEIYFQEPFGGLEAFFTAGSLNTLARELQGRVRTLDLKTVRWPGHASQMQFLLGLGFGEQRIIDVGTHLTYSDVLVRRLQQKLGAEHEDAVLLRSCIHGSKDGQESTLVYEMIESYDKENRLSAMRKCTSIPTATIAFMLASVDLEGCGVAPPETTLPKRRVLDEVKRLGLKIEEHWHQGRVGVTDPDGLRQAVGPN